MAFTLQRNTGSGYATAGASTTVVLALYWHQVIYMQDAAGWWQWTGTSFTPVAGDPRVSVTESPQNTQVTNTTGSIIDANLSAWTLVSSSQGFQVAHAGVTDTSTSNITLLLYWNH